MKTTKVKINVTDRNGAEKMIPWRGHIVSGTEKSFAVTRAAYLWGNSFRADKHWWCVTHLPTGRKHQLTDTKRLAVAMRNARRMYKIFAKHGVAHSTDIEAIKVVKDDFLRTFG